jgi:translation initiation factor 1
MKKPRIDTSGHQSALQSPFASLSLENLPATGPEPLYNTVPTPKNGRVVLRREKSNRGGKTVVVVSDFAPHFSQQDIEHLAKMARQSCGCGGTVRGRDIELQGDNPEKARAFFEREGFRVAGV